MKSMPIQMRVVRQPSVNEAVYMAAYEVYCHVFGPQEELVIEGCRGGIGINKLVAFLYARGFPRNEWRQRFEEAFVNMRLF